MRRRRVGRHITLEPEDRSPSADPKTSIERQKGLKAIARGFALLLVVAGCAQLFTFVIPGLLHLYASSAWPMQMGTMSESVQTSYSGPNAGSSLYNARDIFRIGGGATERFCHWDEPVGTQVRDWIAERLQPGAWLWPRGATVALYVQPGGKMCEPVDGWRRALEQTTFWLRVGVGSCFGAALALWLWQRRLRVPSAP
jgi:hypothetical protein